MSEKTRYYSVNGKGKYLISEKSIPDKNGMIKAIDIHLKKQTLIKKSLLRPWENPVGATLLRGGRY